jgi:phosphoglycolate phosphatase-like HAD superfamily hydrolase
MPFLEGTNIEVVRPVRASCVRHVLLDFDGTVSLIRSGWEQVMVPMMVEILAGLKTGEAEEDLRAGVLDYVTQLTGKQTIYQMIELAEQVRKRGATPREPLEYKRMYHDRLWQKICGRVEGLRSGAIPPERMLVPGARQLIEALRARGLRLYLASGTDEVYTLDEARLLGVAHLFDGGIRGALDDYKSFSKRILIERMIAEQGLQPGELLGFGDGYVEIENTKDAGGIAVAVATDEPECRAVNQWKRQRLLQAGADLVIPNFLECEPLLGYLFRHETVSHQPSVISGPPADA